MLDPHTLKRAMRQRMSPSAVFPLLCLVALFAAMAAQEDVPAPDEGVVVEYVLVDVTAWDKRRQLVTDLALKDFVLRENGKIVVVTSLDILDLREEAASASAPATAVHLDADAPRLERSQVVLALDFQFTGPADATATFSQLEGYLDETAGHDKLGYRIYSLESGWEMEEFSTDPEVVLKALRDYHRRYDQRHTGKNINQGMHLSGLQQGLHLCGGFSQACAREALDRYLAQEEARTETIMRELESLAESFPEGASLRSILFVSPGFSLEPGRGALAMLGADMTSPNASMESRMGLPRLHSFDDRFQEVLSVCARNKVVFHAFDVYNFGMEELYGNTAARSNPGAGNAYKVYRQELQEGMRDLARGTGGTFQTYIKEMRPLLEGNRFVYVLGYAKPDGKPGKFRKIKVKCTRKGIQLRHRTGYIG